MRSSARRERRAGSEHPSRAQSSPARSKQTLRCNKPATSGAQRGTASRRTSADVSPPRVRTAAWLHDASISCRRARRTEARGRAEKGETPFFVAIDRTLARMVAVADRPRGTRPRYTRGASRMGIAVRMISGDRAETAQTSGMSSGSRTCSRRSNPDKARIVFEERARARTVAMVGDGINDAPASRAPTSGSRDRLRRGRRDRCCRYRASPWQGRSLAARSSSDARRCGPSGRTSFWAFVPTWSGSPLCGWAPCIRGPAGSSPVIAGAAMSLSSVSRADELAPPAAPDGLTDVVPGDHTAMMETPLSSRATQASLEGLVDNHRGVPRLPSSDASDDATSPRTSSERSRGLEARHAARRTEAVVPSVLSDPSPTRRSTTSAAARRPTYALARSASRIDDGRGPTGQFAPKCVGASSDLAATLRARYASALRRVGSTERSREGFRGRGQDLGEQRGGALFRRASAPPQPGRGLTCGTYDPRMRQVHVQQRSKGCSRNNPCGLFVFKGASGSTRRRRIAMATRSTGCRRNDHLPRALRHVEESAARSGRCREAR